MRWKDGRARLRAAGEQAVRRGAAVLEAVPVADGEAHARRLGGHADGRQQSPEVRVGAVVEDDEAGVDVVRLVGRVHPDRIGVAAGVVVRLEERDVVVLVQEMRAGQAGDPGPHDRDLQRSAAAASAAPARAEPPARAIVPKRARSERWSPAASVAATSTRSPASVPTSHGRSTPSVTAAQAAPAASATSRAPSPRMTTWTDGRSASGPSQLVPTRPGAASRPAPKAVRPRAKAIVELLDRRHRSPLLAARAVRSLVREAHASASRGRLARRPAREGFPAARPQVAHGRRERPPSSTTKEQRAMSEVGIPASSRQGGLVTRSGSTGTASTSSSSGSGLTSSRARLARSPDSDRVAMVAAARERAC